MGEAALRRITVDEFLAWDGEGDRRYELVGGEIVAMAPASNAHAIIVANLIGELRQRLKAPCRVFNEVGIRLPLDDGAYYVADAAISCAPFDPKRAGLSDPQMIIEVLSPTTASHDRGLKLAEYRRIQSVNDIILIASDEKRVEHWRRGEGAWTVVDLRAADLLSIASFGFDIPVEALYDGLDFS